MSYILEIANAGTSEAIKQNPAIERAVNTHNGELVHLTLLSQGARDGLE
jgi:alanine dehydrogenase